MKIAIDAMGGDYAPKSVIEGALMAKTELSSGVEIVLVGNESVIESVSGDLGMNLSKITIIHASEVIEMEDSPTKALSQKLDSSISVGFKLLKSKKVDAFCGLGNTGAMHIGAMFSVKSVEGIIRPALASFMPKEQGKWGVIIDVGANADCKPDVLQQFAELGSIYANCIFNIDNPKVGLLNLGEEEHKGTLLTQAAYQLIKINKNINFIGNIEGRDMFNNKADVIVCDGFTGNVILKMAESIHQILKNRDLLDPFFERFNYELVGGSPILGVKGDVVIGHGISSPLATKNMILLAKKMIDSNINKKIRNAFKGSLLSFRKRKF